MHQGPRPIFISESYKYLFFGITYNHLPYTHYRIDERAVTDRVSPDKDVDGLGTVNQGKLAAGDMETGFMPCTPAGCMELIRRSGVEIAGAEAVVIGRSKIVGSPMAQGTRRRLILFVDHQLRSCATLSSQISTK